MMFVDKLLSYIIRPGDDRHEVFIKKILLIGTVFVLIGNALILLNDPVEIEVVFCTIGLLNAFPMLYQLFVIRRSDNVILEFLIYSIGVTFICGDLYEISLGSENRIWPFFVVLIDVCLVCRFPKRVPINTIIGLVVWFTILYVEQTNRFGLFDLSMLSTQQQRRESISCSTLPCKTQYLTTFEATFTQLSIFLLDFYFTRGFASELHKEHDKMNKVIAATEDIATSLSRFDLEAAEDIISAASLPPPLYDAFSNILANLKNYRPYLPDALFHSMHSEGKRHCSEVPPPGLQSERATLVFTDIQGSTATWEACPEGMQEGLQVHNQAIRDCIAEHNGYEVKTIGDAFMVAFESASDAVWFGLSVQERLVKSVWPEELLDTVDHCSWDAEGPWCGLRVRVGVHCGDVSLQLNNLTGRYDYFGNTVNKAARMEGACVGGAVAVTPEVMEAVGPLDSVSVIPMGQTELKGVGDSLNPFLLLPRSLLGRTSFVEEQLFVKREERKLIICRSESAKSLRDDKENSLSYLGQSMRTSATVGKVELALRNYESKSEVMKKMNAGLAKILTCTERSHGAVVSLQGNRVAVCWNCTKPCPTHVENSLVFVKMLGMTAELGNGLGGEASIHVGMSTSTMFHGTVGDRKQKFMTVLGTGVVVSSSLCSDAVSCGVLCYYACSLSEPSSKDMSFTEKGTYDAPDGTSLRLLEVKVMTRVEQFESSDQLSVL